jgi:hypothetical protein
MTDGLRIEVDWTKTGTYVDESARVKVEGDGAAPVTVSYGRDQSTALAPTVSGTGSFTLANDDRRFSPRNAASPLYGTIKPARPVRITREWSGTTYTLGQFHTDDSPINPDIVAKTVSLSLLDSLADFRGNTISTPLYRGIRTGQAIGYILDACGWDADLRSLDSGATVIPWWWEDGTDALTALDKALRSEGPPAMLTVGTDGSIVFWDRHHRLLRATSQTSQQTWVDNSQTLGPGVIGLSEPFSYNEAWNNIVNSSVATVDVRVPGVLQQVWTSEDTMTFTAGEQKIITVSGTDPFYSAVTPVSGTDYTVHTGNVTAALLRTSGGSTAIVLTAIAAVARISNLQLRAYPVPVAHSVQISEANPDSKTEYGTRSYPGDLPWCNPYDAKAVLSTAVAMRAEPLPILQVRFLIGNDPTKAPLLSLDLSDRVTVIEPETSTNADFYIESIAHEFTDTFDHTVTFGLEAAHDIVTDVFRFDVAGQGFNDGLFGSGLDDPATMFRFDGTSGHRFNEGVFAT